jgi:hypothetical protein
MTSSRSPPRLNAAPSCARPCYRVRHRRLRTSRAAGFMPTRCGAACPGSIDGRRHPHYARALRSESDVRVIAVMNFYTESYPESTRPRELNRHLYGDD